MQSIIETIQNAFLKELNKDKKFSENEIPISFWQELSNDLIFFQENAKPIYAKMYSLDLDNQEKIIAKIPQFYSLLIKEIAEQYVIDENFQAATYFIERKNPEFLEQVQFLKTLKNVITKVERENLKLNLANGLDRLSFTISDAEMVQAIKMQERKALKKKFAQWDEELMDLQQPKILYSLPRKEPTKPATQSDKNVISLYWVKYAVAACFVLGIGFWLFETNKFDPETNNNTIVTTKPKDTTSHSPVENSVRPKEVIVYETKSIQSKLQHPSELGFTTTDEKNNVQIIYKDASKQINNLTSQLKIKQDKTIEDQLYILKSQHGKYEFNGKQLVVYTNDFKMKIAVITLDGKDFYVKKNENYFRIYFTKLHTNFAPVKDENSLEQLEKISFENE